MRKYDLELNTYLQLGAVHKNAFAVLPLETKKKIQRFVIGDDSNTLQMYEFKKGNLQQAWKTDQMEKEISKVTISENNKKVNTFWASGHSIKGINKKGKEFFKFDTNHTEDIKNLYVHGTNLWSAGDYILNSYVGSKEGISDNFYYLSDDKIYDMLVQNVSGSLVFNTVLGWDDSSVRILVENEIYYSQGFSSPVTTLWDGSNVSTSSTPHTAYGLKNGGFGMIDMQRDAPLILWDVNDITAASDAPINIIHIGKFNDDSEDNDVVIARDDGSWEIYSFNENEHPHLKYWLNFQESIVGLGLGYVSKADFKEVVVSLFSGKVASLMDSNAITMDETPVVERKQKIETLVKEKDKLADKVNKKRVKDMESKKYTDISIVGFKSNYKFTIIPKEAAYLLTIESQIMMSVVLLQSEINVDLLDSENIPGQVSFSPPDPTNPQNQFLVTLKLHEQWNRLVLKVRASEGLFGAINVFIIPPEENTKVWKRIEIPILPLSLHQKVNEIKNKDDLELSFITLTGNFFQNDILNWISRWLPDVPKLQESEKNILYFKSTFIGTVLIVSIANKTSTISSNNLSALTILKSTITSEASKKGIMIEISSNIVDESIEINLALINPKVEEQYKLAKNVQLIDGLKELQMQEDDLSFLSEEYKEILSNADQIKEQFKTQPRKLHFLWGIIADLYNDAAIIKGIHDVSGKMPKLKQILDHYDFDELVHFFKTSI